MLGRLGQGVALVLVSVLTAEIVSFGILWVLNGDVVTHGDLAARRAALEMDIRDRDTLPKGVLGDRPVFRADTHVLHPFLGSVRHPSRGEHPRRTPWAVELGFDRSAQAFFAAPSKQRVVVAVFGGSVADMFVRFAGPRLAAALAASDRFAGEEVVVGSAAFGGFKQPQQLMALNYLLVNGARLSIVINIDGFNEVAFPPVDQIPKRVWPFFPRDWYYRVARLGPELRLSVGEIAFVRQRRVELAERFSQPWSRVSLTAGLLWYLLDRRLAAQAAQAEQAIVREAERDDRYQIRGPREDLGAPEKLYSRLAEMWWKSSVQMQRLSDANGIEYYHFLQPNQYVEGSKPLTAEERKIAFRSDHEYRPGVELGYPKLRAVADRAAQEGVSFHDFSYLFRDVDETLYLDDCCHFNETGAAILADAIAGVIAQRP